MPIIVFTAKKKYIYLPWQHQNCTARQKVTIFEVSFVATKTLCLYSNPLQSQTFLPIPRQMAFLYPNQDDLKLLVFLVYLDAIMQIKPDKKEIFFLINYFYYKYYKRTNKSLLHIKYKYMYIHLFFIDLMPQALTKESMKDKQ